MAHIYCELVKRATSIAPTYYEGTFSRHTQKYNYWKICEYVHEILSLISHTISQRDPIIQLTFTQTCIKYTHKIKTVDRYAHDCSAVLLHQVHIDFNQNI